MPLKFDSIDGSESTKELMDKMQNEKEYKENAEKTVEKVQKLWKQYQSEKPLDNEEVLRKKWRIGRVIHNFHEEYGYSYRECGNCGYKNPSPNQRCTMCNHTMPDPIKPVPYKNREEIKKRIDELEDSAVGKQQVEQMRKFYRMFPEGDYDESVTFSSYESLMYMINYPETVWKEFYNYLRNDSVEGKVPDDVVEFHYSDAGRSSKERVLRKVAMLKWEILNGFADYSAGSEAEAERLAREHVFEHNEK